MAYCESAERLLGIRLGLLHPQRIDVYLQARVYRDVCMLANGRDEVEDGVEARPHVRARLVVLIRECLLEADLQLPERDLQVRTGHGVQMRQDGLHQLVHV